MFFKPIPAFDVIALAQWRFLRPAGGLDHVARLEHEGPTTLAVRLAEEAGLTLVAFARRGRLTVYAGPARLNP